MDGKTRWLMYGAGILVVAAIVIPLVLRRTPSVIRGAVVTSDPDPTRELPVGGVEITTPEVPDLPPVQSNDTGAFEFPLPWRLRAGQRVALSFRHPNYRPLDLTHVASEQLCIAHLVPLSPVIVPAEPTPAVTVSNVVVQYSMATVTLTNVGSVVKTFQVVNTGNLPCKTNPCSPDGRWKATEVSASLAAGDGNQLRNARVSCIAGPCPFTRILGDGVSLSHDNRTARVSELDWSDTTTFLFEAEVYKPVTNNVLRQNYPLIFDTALTFTLPASAEGVSIAAELNREGIVFPLGPALLLTWADCQMLVNPDQARVYRCELKPGYGFASSVQAAASR